MMNDTYKSAEAQYRELYHHTAAERDQLRDRLMQMEQRCGAREALREAIERQRKAAVRLGRLDFSAREAGQAGRDVVRLKEQLAALDAEPPEPEARP